MYWHKAWYGSWNQPGGVKTICFDGPGEEYKYTTGTYDRKKAFDKAKETAKQTGEIVTVCKEVGHWSGRRDVLYKVYPSGEVKEL